VWACVCGISICRQWTARFVCFAHMMGLCQSQKTIKKVDGFLCHSTLASFASHNYLSLVTSVSKWIKIYSVRSYIIQILCCINYLLFYAILHSYSLRPCLHLLHLLHCSFVIWLLYVWIRYVDMALQLECLCVCFFYLISLYHECYNCILSVV